MKKLSFFEWGMFSTSTLAIILVNIPELSKYACIVGLISQVFWFYETYRKKLTVMFILSFLYTCSWGIGLYNNFIK